jgi:hypothetical protein
MSEFDDSINVTPIPGGGYNVFSGYSKETIAFTPGGLLALGDWITAHHGELTRMVNGPEGNSPYASDPRDPAYWNAPGIDEGTAHYNPRAGLETEHGGREWWEANTDEQEAIEPLTPGDDHESIEEHLQELSEQEHRQAEGE